MAVVKMGKIRGALSGSIAYIVNPVKTHGGVLCSTNCAIVPSDAAEITAAMEETLALAEMRRTGGRPSKITAYHVIQSFKPGEVSPHDAHMIGVEFAKKIAGQRYDYVISTHIDQGHIHNHIIHSAVDRHFFNRARFSRGYIQDIRDISDELCIKYGLSVIEPAHRGYSLGAMYVRARGESRLVPLMEQIDQAVKESRTLDDMRALLGGQGVQVETRGVHILFKAPGMKYPIRGKTLGLAYTANGLMTRLGRDEVCEFTVAKGLVEGVDAARVRVRLPGHVPYAYVTVPASKLVDYGGGYRMFIPAAWDLRMLDRHGVNLGQISVPDLYTFFSPPKTIEATGVGVVPQTRGVSAAQRAYFANVDKKVAKLREDIEYLGVLYEYRSATDPEAFVKRLAERLDTGDSESSKLLVSRQKHADYGMNTSRIDMKLARYTRQRQAIFSLARTHKLDIDRYRKRPVVDQQNVRERHQQEQNTYRKRLRR
ncbi:MAG: relaxase/mobilization nuclease domain-containing protein [Arcanobacterium sp.]